MAVSGPEHPVTGGAIQSCRCENSVALAIPGSGHSVYITHSHARDADHWHARWRWRARWRETKASAGVPRFGSRCRRGSRRRHSSSKSSTPVERGGASTQSDLARHHRPRGRHRPPAALPHGAIVHDPPQPLRGDQRHQHEHDDTVPHLHLRVANLLQQACTLKHPSCGKGGRAAPALDIPTGMAT